MNRFWSIRDELGLNHMIVGMIYSLFVFIIGYMITVMARRLLFGFIKLHNFYFARIQI